MDRPGELDPLAPRQAPEPAVLPEAETAEERMARHRSLAAKLLAPLIVVIGLLVKFGAFALKFFGIFISVAAYALIWGWRFAVGFVFLILVHELGHFLEAKRQGLNPSLPVFVPFLGAYVLLRDAPFDPWRNALVSLAGPIAGGAAAAGFLVAGEIEDSGLLLALAYTGFFLNLFNMIPVAFLDGGHTLRAWRVLRRGGGRATPAEARRLGWAVAALAVGTVAALVVGMVAAHLPQDRL